MFNSQFFIHCLVIIGRAGDAFGVRVDRFGLSVNGRAKFTAVVIFATKAPERTLSAHTAKRVLSTHAAKTP